MCSVKPRSAFLKISSLLFNILPLANAEVLEGDCLVDKIGSDYVTSLISLQVDR